MAVERAQLFLQDRQYWPVELLRLCDAHLVDLETNDVEPGAGKNLDNASWSQVWELEIIRLNQDERLLDFCVSGKSDDLIEDSSI